MNLKITKEKAEYNKSKLGNSKMLVMVEFPNCISTKTNKPFKWIPTYEQIYQILKNLGEIEKESWKNTQLNTTGGKNEQSN